MEDCIFCKIVTGEIPCYKIFENENVLAFLDIADDCMGHTLVIPKQHCENIFSIDDETYCNVIKTVKMISKHYVDDCGFEGVNIINSNGISAEQSVPHFHVHIFPRLKEDGLHVWPVLERQYQDFEKVQKKLKIN